MKNVVTENDIPPRGKPGECFWCHATLGEPHKYECSAVTKLVEVAITITGVIEVPLSWDADMIELHMNRDSNCINNQLDFIQGEAMCFCGRAAGKYLKDLPKQRPHLRIIDGCKADHDESA